MTTHFSLLQLPHETPNVFSLMETGFHLFLDSGYRSTRIKIIQAKFYPFQIFYEKLICGNYTIPHWIDEDLTREILSLKNNVIAFSGLKLPDRWISNLVYSANERLLFKFLLQHSPIALQGFLNIYQINNLNRLMELFAHENWITFLKAAKNLSPDFAGILCDFESHLKEILNEFNDKQVGLFSLLDIYCFKLNKFNQVRKNILQSN